MKNTHLEHPEDSILLGDLSVLDFLTARDHIGTIKWDGSPALVWGNCPKTGKFFVGTKSVFNKVKVKVNYTHADIERNHGDGPVACILHTALETLPCPERGNVQGDFIGFGSGSIFKPQLIEYVFKKKFTAPIIVVPHTSYEGPFLDPDCRFGSPFQTPKTGIISSPDISVRYRSFSIRVLAARTIARFTKFATPQSQQAIKTHINSYIRKDGKFPSARVMYEELPSKYKGEVNVNLFRLYLSIHAIKMQLLRCVCDDTSWLVECRIMDKPSTHEGYVMTTNGQTYKIVDRTTFSYANFTIAKTWN